MVFVESSLTSLNPHASIIFEANTVLPANVSVEEWIYRLHIRYVGILPAPGIPWSHNIEDSGASVPFHSSTGFL